MKAFLVCVVYRLLALTAMDMTTHMFGDDSLFFHPQDSLAFWAKPPVATMGKNFRMSSWFPLVLDVAGFAAALTMLQA